MSYQGTERRDTTAKGRAIREAMAVEGVLDAEGFGGMLRYVDKMTVGHFAGILGRLWTTAYAQGRADLSREMREDFDAKLRSLLEEYGVR